MKERILITDGDQRSSLACVRSLGRAGYGCFVLGPDRGGLAGRSVYCQEGASAPDPLEDPDGFLEFAKDAGSRWSIDVLLPMTEKSLRVILPNRESFPSVSIPFPEADVFGAVSDKDTVWRAAKKVGIEVPRQWVWENPEQISGNPVDIGAFPVVVKPTTSVSPTGKKRGGVGLRYLNGPEALREWEGEVTPESFPVMVQERIFGYGAGVFLFMWNGELLAAVGHRRIREKPPSGGVSVLRESTAVDPGILDRSLQLLDTLGWESGVAMVEFKVQDGTEIPYLMEINGRFWGSLQLAIDSGVDFPALLVDAGLGRPPGKVVMGTPGVKTRWLLGDIDQLLVRLVRSRSRLDLPEGYPGRLTSVLQFLGDFRPGVHLETCKLSDFRPFLWEVRSWFSALI